MTLNEALNFSPKERYKEFLQCLPLALAQESKATAHPKVLFDYKLKQEGINPETIEGYDREMATHMAVAAAVASDGADAGMGILSASKAMGLDFIEVAPEEYDFVIPQRFLNLPHVEAFIEILKSDNFRNRLEELGGYSYDRAGEVVLI